MNKRSILKTNDSARDSAQNSEAANQAPKQVNQSSQSPSCKDGLCQVNWKPQRPAA